MGFLSGFFSKKETASTPFLSALRVDLHSHLVPGIDDGSTSLDQSVELVREMMGLGYTKIITTPHISAEHFPNTSSIIRAGFAKLKQRLHEEAIDIDIEVGAEYMIDSGLMEKIKSGDLLSFSGNHILVEMPLYMPYPDYASILFELQTSGYKIILAHPERYSYWHSNFKHYDALKDREILFQMNIGSLAGRNSNPLKKIAHHLIEDEMIDLLGSDIHNINYVDAIRETEGDKHLEKLISSGKLLNPGL
jgi:protein-tyrosine phosphatase